MRRIRQLISKLARDERGGEVLEYAMIAAVIIVATIVAILSVGGKSLITWTSLKCDL